MRSCLLATGVEFISISISAYDYGSGSGFRPLRGCKGEEIHSSPHEEKGTSGLQELIRKVSREQGFRIEP